MAGIKITDLSALSVAEATDYLCIVDVSDTSQSPAGTTKKIELGNIIESGEYIPVITSYNSNATNINVINSIYSKIGNAVTLTIFCSADFDFTADRQAILIYSTPFSSTNNGGGIVNCLNTDFLNSTYPTCNGIAFNNQLFFFSNQNINLIGVNFVAIINYLA